MEKQSGGGELIDRNVCGSGVPIGNVTSQIFANIYLNELDQFVKHSLRSRHYFRYADDFIIIHNDPIYLQNTLEHISQFLQENLYLKLHPQKVEIRKFRQGIDFLGYVILPHHIVVRTKTKRRIFKKLSEKHELWTKQKIDDYSFRQSFESYLGMVGHSDGYDLENLIKNTFGNQSR